MKISSVHIHNFRSIEDVKFHLQDYNVLVGSNNSGKSNIVSALRIFYEDEDIKYDEMSDFPKFNTNDDESWVEVEYVLSENELDVFGNEYLSDKNRLAIRKYLKSEDKNKMKNLFVYKNGTFYDKFSYGIKEIPHILGSVIYIPGIKTINEALKTSGPSPFRQLLNLIVKEISEESQSFQELKNEFIKFNSAFKTEKTKDGLSLQDIENQINEELRHWSVQFNIKINSIEPEEIIKTLVDHKFLDETLGEEMKVTQYGLGVQRHLIYALIKIASQYNRTKKSNAKKEIFSDFTLILFEEPEVFLHPSQQEILNIGLRDLAKATNKQVIVTTHSQLFVSRNIEELPSLIRVKKEEGKTKVYQITNEKIEELINKNNELFLMLKNKLEDPQTPPNMKNNIIKIIGNTDDERRLKEESIRYLSWLDSERCCAFFADMVLICEGASEKVFVDYLVRNKIKDLCERKIYVLDAMGKFNIHRYMNLFGELGIPHSVLMDKDQDKNIHLLINHFIMSKKNNYTKKIDFFEDNIETFLGIPTVTEDWKKPINILWCYFNNKISESRLNDLIGKIKNLIY